MSSSRSPLLWLLVASAFGLVVYRVATRSVDRQPAAIASLDRAPPSVRAPAAPAHAQPSASEPTPAPSTAVVGEPPPARDLAAFDAIRALVDERRIGDARVRAERFFVEYPDSPYRGRVEQLTGVHPHPPPPH